MTEITPACARPTRSYPEGRTGTPAGYTAHRGAGEAPCQPCTAAWSARCAERARSLSSEEHKERRDGQAASGRRRRAEKRAQALACADTLQGTTAGYEAHVAVGQRPCPPCREATAAYGPACAIPTKKYPGGRTGTGAGYQAHKDHGEAPCEPCTAAWTEVGTARRQAFSDEERARFRKANAEAHKRWRERDPEAARATKHRTIAKNRDAVRAAKSKPCADCGTQYPYYVMEFDHLDAGTKHFNVSAGVTRASHERILAEIAKCEAVCANCHAERTHQRKQARKGAQADAVH